MVVPMVMVCGRQFRTRVKTNRTREKVPALRGLVGWTYAEQLDRSGNYRRDNALFKKFEFVFVGAGQFDPVAGVQRQEIFAVNMRFHFPDLPDIDDG